MDNLQISGDVSIFCPNANLILCITQALGLTKNKIRSSVDKHRGLNMNQPPVNTSTTTKHVKENSTTNSRHGNLNLFNESFDYYQNVTFFSTMYFENVMIGDVHFFKRSYHVNMTTIKDMYDKCMKDKKKYLEKSVSGFGEKDVNNIAEIPMETITISHRVHKIDNAVVNAVKKITKPQKDTLIRFKTVRRERSSSTTEIDNPKNKPVVLDLPSADNVPKLFRKNLGDIYYDMDTSEIKNHDKISDITLESPRNSTKSDNIDGTNDDDKRPAESDDDSSTSTIMEDFESGTLSSLHYLGYNYIHTRSVNMELTNLYDTFSSEQWKILYNMIKYWGFSLSDAKDFTDKYEQKRRIIPPEHLSKTDDYVGISTSVINEAEITCVNMNLFIPTDWSLFEKYTMKNILKNYSKRKADSSDSTHTETESDGDDNVNGDKTGLDVEENVPVKGFDSIRPIKPMCYIVFIDLLNDSNVIQAELEALFHVIKQTMATDSAVGIDIKWAMEVDSTTAKDLVNHILEKRFEKNKTFVAIVGHSSIDIPLEQIKEKIRIREPQFEVDIIGDKQEEKDKGIHNMKKKLHSIEKSVESIQKLATNFFGSHFVYYNIDATIPRQVVLTFQKIATIILRQTRLKSNTYVNKQVNKSNMNAYKKILKMDADLTQTLFGRSAHITRDEEKLLACLRYFFSTLLKAN